MIKSQFDSVLTQLVHVRNRLGVALGIAAFLLVFLLLIIVLLAGNRERIVVLPDVVTEPFTLTAKKVSSSYLRQMADYYTRLVYSTTPQSVDAQIETLLFHVSPKHIPALKSQLIVYADAIKQKNIMSTFYPREFTIDTDNLTIDVVGDFVLLLGSEQLHHTKVFKLQFLYEQGRLWIKQMEEVVS